MTDILITIIAGILANALFLIIERITRRKHSNSAAPSVNYAERLAALTQALKSSSEEVDKVIGELAGVAEEREAAVQDLETQLASLSQREQELQDRIEQLKNVPIPVAEHFARLAAAGERRSAMRDYILFSLGVVVSTAISIVFFVLQQK